LARSFSFNYVFVGGIIGIDRIIKMKEKILNAIKKLRSRPTFDKIIIHLTLSILFFWFLWEGGEIWYDSYGTSMWGDGIFYFPLFVLAITYIIFGGKKNK
tara:strand:+ start:483 stop:782 length:300 start_codon:yes stop_codon:yes gene_type:complete